jgi:hypothetical protein
MFTGNKVPRKPCYRQWRRGLLWRVLPIKGAIRQDSGDGARRCGRRVNGARRARRDRMLCGGDGGRWLHLASWPEWAWIGRAGRDFSTWWRRGDHVFVVATVVVVSANMGGLLLRAHVGGDACGGWPIHFRQWGRCCPLSSLAQASILHPRSPDPVQSASYNIIGVLVDC